MSKRPYTVRYEVRTPLHGAADPYAEGSTVSRHRTLPAAVKGLERHAKGCAHQGGYSTAIIYDTVEGRRVIPETGLA